jgi:hypothetical protein
MLSDDILRKAITVMKPVVFLDTAIRFSLSTDENSAAQNKQLADDIIALRQAGAIAVIALHHSTKAAKKSEMTLENVLRGSGDIAALPDAVYGLRRDDILYDHGRGPNEVEVVCVKPRDFDPPQPFKIAATYKKDESILPVSWIDETGDFHLVEIGESLKHEDTALTDLIKNYPTMSLDDVAEQTGLRKWKVQRKLQDLGWTKSRGPNSGWSQNRPASLDNVVVEGINDDSEPVSQPIEQNVPQGTLQL